MRNGSKTASRKKMANSGNIIEKKFKNGKIGKTTSLSGG